MGRDVAKGCGLWGQVVQRREQRWSNNAVVAFTVVMTWLLIAPVAMGGLARLLGVLSFVVMFALVFRSRGLRVVLVALGFIAALWAGVFAFGVLLGLLLG
jgi:hypothetical protein